MKVNFDVFLQRGIQTIGSVRGEDAAVLLPVIEKDEHTFILFEVRAKNVSQAGEICFPGGRIEPGESPEAAALRETAEELCLPRENMALAAPLFTLSGPGGRLVHAFGGRLFGYEGTFSRKEVARTFLMDVEMLLAMQPRVARGYLETVPDGDFPYELIPGGRAYPFRRVPRTFYFYETKDGVIWGMTAMLLFHFLEALRGGEDA